ncbi:hypothetical protein AU476_07375 [Cupriavidus sp. UYMSc13B]|nr:hypothetical protein AU476_07375 [Cupriavidus sp. UYMSc13B]
MKTARQQLIEALLRDGVVRSARFAQMAKVSRQLVHTEMVRLEKAGAVLRLRGQCVLVNAEALPTIVERTVVEAPPREVGGAAELLAFFGIRPAHIQLPARRHFRSDQVPA